MATGKRYEIVVQVEGGWQNALAGHCDDLRVAYVQCQILQVEAAKRGEGRVYNVAERPQS